MRLWIIGNGFDLAHDLPTSYSNYYTYLISQNEKWMTKMLEFYFGNIAGHPYNILWSQLEKALGIYSVDAIYDFLKEGHILELGNESRYIEEVESEVQYHFVRICKKFKETFTEWCHRIDLRTIKPQGVYGFTDTDFFLSFNYTETLETVYGIDGRNVIHIHGRAARGDDLIVGHNNPAEMPKRIVDNILDNTANIRAIVETINNLEKKTNENIAANRLFFDSLCVVDEVIVYGHSIEDVDLDYFAEVEKCTDQNAKWTFFCYDATKKQHYDDVAMRLGISRELYKLIDFL